jgi:predicted transport protein
MTQIPLIDTKRHVWPTSMRGRPERGGAARLSPAWRFVFCKTHAITSMAIYSISNNTAKKIPPVKIGLEKDIQKIFEKNLEEILNITFLASEYSTSSGGRMDTLGIDHNNSPVIIEYKRGQNDSVINQGLSYLLWLLDHKDTFKEIAHRASVTTSIDWGSPRVICVAESYNKFDLDTANLLPMDIELLRYRMYENGILLVEPEVQRKVKISTSEIFEKTEKQKGEFKEKIKHTVADHLEAASPHAKELFAVIKEKIAALDESIIEEPKAKYIAYKMTTNFVDIVVYKDSLKIFLNIPSGTLNDPAGLARDLTKPKPIGHWGNGDYEVKLDRDEDIDTIMALIKQSYEYNK